MSLVLGAGIGGGGTGTGELCLNEVTFDGKIVLETMTKSFFQLKNDHTPSFFLIVPFFFFFSPCNRSRAALSWFFDVSDLVQGCRGFLLDNRRSCEISSDRWLL